MNIIIIGGGKLGYFLTKSLYKGHQVTLIEKDKAKCYKIAEEFKDAVVWGDGTKLDVLEDAGADEKTILVAATGRDEENLIICQIASLNFKTEHTIARINNPKNAYIFQKLGIKNTVCDTEVIANLIEHALKLR